MSLMIAVLLTLSPGIRLADDAPRAATLQTMTQDQIVARLVELKATRPSFVGPIVMMSVGAALAIPGSYFLYATLTVASATSMSGGGLLGLFGVVGTVIFGFLTAVFLVPAVILLVIGAIQLPLRLSALRQHEEEEDALKRQLNAAPADAPPPPPPPPPSQVFYLRPALQTVMTF